MVAIVGGVLAYDLWLEPPGPRVVFYGDSLAVEAGEDFSDLLTEGNDLEVTVRAFGGTAICDWLLPMQKDAEELDPVAVVIEFVGNRRTDCMRDPGGDFLDETAALEKYQRDLGIALRTWRSREVPVYLVAPPGAVGQADPGPLHDVYTDAAERSGPGVQLIDAADPLRSTDGTYSERLPCLPSEDADDGCRDGTISVRASDGVHFCDEHEGAACAGYASGAFRFAREIAGPLRRDLVG